MRSTWVPPAVTTLPVRATANAPGMGIDFIVQAVIFPFSPPRAHPVDRSLTMTDASRVTPQRGTAATASEPKQRTWAPPAVTKLPI